MKKKSMRGRKEAKICYGRSLPVFPFAFPKSKTTYSFLYHQYQCSRARARERERESKISADTIVKK